MERIFNILENKNCKATFFCLGWIAEVYPEVIRGIADRGYEIGTHTRMHQLVYEQTHKEFTLDLEESVKTLEDITGKKVKYFRAPGFSIGEDNKWAFEVMAKQGIEVDCSIFPANRAHGGFPSYNEQVPSIIRYNGIELKEFPINYYSIFGKAIIFSGGGYFRLFSYPFIKHMTNKSNYVMSYIHPRDLDAEQPRIQDLSMYRIFKSYTGIKGASLKLENWLTDFEFIDVGTAVKEINWDTVPIVNL